MGDVDVNAQISKYLSDLAEETKQIGYGEFVKPPVLNVGDVGYSNEVYMPDDGRALDGSMHRGKVQLVVNGKNAKSIVDGFELPRAKG